MKEIAILGGGIVGLSTAFRLIELSSVKNSALPQPLNITIFAENFLKETTSGIFNFSYSYIMTNELM